MKYGEKGESQMDTQKIALVTNKGLMVFSLLLGWNTCLAI
jgi:hypothetical protein